MKQKFYRLADSNGQMFYQWKFTTQEEADAWRRMQGRADWRIV